MTTLQHLLIELEQNNVRLWADGEKLRCQAAKGVLTEALVKQMQEHKSDLMRLLQEGTKAPLDSEDALAAGASALHRLASHDSVPLSFAQRRLWFLDQLGAGATYNMSGTVELRGPLDFLALQRSIQEVVRRHESLRTTYHSRDGEPYQRVNQSFTPTLPRVELQHLPPPVQKRTVAKLARDESARPFDLAQDLMLRTTLVQLGSVEHLLVYTMHHIASDAWSLNIFAQELAALYGAFAQAKPSPLAPLLVQYADYAHWQRSQDQRRELAYWSQQLSKPLPVLALPFDSPPPAVADHRGGHFTAQLSPTLTAGLRALAKDQEATTFIVLFATLSLLFHRYTGQEDIILGTPSVGRSAPGTEALIGLFLNTLALRIHFSGISSFLQLVQRAREVTLNAFSHQEAPFEKVVEMVNPDRRPGRDPVFEAMLNFTSATQPRANVLPLAMTAKKNTESPALRALTIYASEVDSAIEFELVYQRALFSAERMAWVLDQLVWLLEQVVAKPAQPLHAFSLVTPKMQALLPELKRDLPAPPQEPITQMLRRWADHTPLAPAVEWLERSYTYQELWQRSQEIAQKLTTRGLKKGDVVAVYGARSFGVVTSLFGVLLGGGVILPIGKNTPPLRLQAMLDIGRARFILTTAEEAAAPGSAPPSHLGSTPLPLFFVSAQDGRMEGPAAPEVALSVVQDEDPAYIMFTSGTTGQPKGILGVHRGLSHFLAWQRTNFGVGPTDRCAQHTALSFDVMLRDMFLAPTSGATLCLLAPELELDGEAFLRWLARERITLVHLVPSLGQVWAQHAAAEYRHHSLRWSFFAGEPLTDSLVDRWRQLFPGSQIVNLYGPTETTMAKCWYLVPPLPSPGIQPVGCPLPQTQALVLDGHDQPCGVGEAGQIVIRTPFRTLGYLNPEHNEQRFVQNPQRSDAEDLLYYTGDRGRYRPDGALDILGRVDDELKISGVRVRPAEIMALLNQHPAVSASVVVLQNQPQDQATVNRLIAYVVAKPNTGVRPQPQELRHHLSQSLPAALVPSAFIFIDAIPTTTNGKVDRHALPPASPDENHDHFAVPRNELERQMVKLWQELLGLHAVSIHDNFFDLGGHSLIAVHLMARIARQFGQKLPLAVLFSCPTVELLVAHLGNDTAATVWSPLVAIQPRGERRPLFCVPGLGGNVLYLHRLARWLGPEQPFYGLQSVGLDGISQPHVSVEQMATDYIRAIKEVQNSGPYQLCGHSFGGQVAFEMGLQLRRCGDEVAFIALLDAGPPAGVDEDIPLLLDEASALAEMAAILAFMSGRELDLPQELLRPLSAQERLCTFKQRMEEAGLLPRNTDLQQVRGWLAVFKCNYQMVYIPQVTHPLRVVYLYAQEQNQEARLRRLEGWRRFTPLTASETPGSHLTMMAEPGISVLAERLKVLAEAAN